MKKGKQKIEKSMLIKSAGSGATNCCKHKEVKENGIQTKI